MEAFPRSEAAARAGVSAEYLDSLIELGLVQPDADGRLGLGGLRRVMVLQALDDAGIPLDGLAQFSQSGQFSLDFIEAAGYDAFAPMADVSFAEMTRRSGVPFELLSAVRELTGGIPPAPDDRMRQDELAIVPLVELHLREGFRPQVIERTLRVLGDSLRRVAETEAEWWRSEVQDRMIADGRSAGEVAQYARDMAPELSRVSDQALLAIYHAQQRLSWSVNIINGIAGALMKAGLHTRSERPPAICFLDITGYTRLTQDQGDSAAAALAERVARLVQRTAVEHGGRAVKWLGDGVMLFFPEAGSGVLAALAVLERVGDAGLPPAHVGLHAGPVLFQEGDYYGQTVNMAARIGDYARPGEVLASQAVVELSAGQPVDFRALGAVELKGISGAVQLYSAARASRPAIADAPS